MRDALSAPFIVSWSRDIDGAEKETPSLALEICKFHQSYFRPIKRNRTVSLLEKKD